MLENRRHETAGRGIDDEGRPSRPQALGELAWDFAKGASPYANAGKVLGSFRALCAALFRLGRRFLSSLRHDFEKLRPAVLKD